MNLWSSVKTVSQTCAHVPHKTTETDERIKDKNRKHRSVSNVDLVSCKILPFVFKLEPPAFFLRHSFIKTNRKSKDILHMIQKLTLNAGIKWLHAFLPVLHHKQTYQIIIFSLHRYLKILFRAFLQWHWTVVAEKCTPLQVRWIKNGLPVIFCIASHVVQHSLSLCSQAILQMHLKVF